MLFVGGYPWSTGRQTQHLHLGIAYLEPLSRKIECHSGLLVERVLNQEAFHILEVAWLCVLVVKSVHSLHKPTIFAKRKTETSNRLIFPSWHALPLRFNVLWDSIWQNSAVGTEVPRWDKCTCRSAAFVISNVVVNRRSVDV